MKICVIDDEIEALRKRYGGLAKTHRDQTHVVFGSMYPYVDNDIATDLVGKDKIIGIGFNPDNLHFGLRNMPDDGDIYFCDGLDGVCFKLAEKLGNKIFYLNTGDPMLKERAREIGIKVCEQPVREIIDSLFPNQSR